MAPRRFATYLLAIACSSFYFHPRAAHALDLLDAYRLAVTKDANYQMARATADVVREQVPQARANLLPQVSISASQTRNDTRQASENQFTRKTTTHNYEYDGENHSLNLRQPIFRLGNVAQYQQATARVESAEATLDSETQAMALRVAGAYFDTLTARARLEALQAQKEAYAAQLDAAERSYKMGFGTRIDIDDALARHQLSIAQEIDARHQLDVAERTLAGIINQRVPAAALSVFDEKKLVLAPPQPNQLETWLNQGIASNPELRALRHDIEAAEKEIDRGRAAHLPTLDLVASRSYSGSDSVTTVGNEYWTNTVGLQLSIPLYSGGQVSSVIREAHARLERTRQQYEAAQRQLEVNVAKEFGAVTQGVARVQALEQGLRAAEQSVVSTRKGVQAGTRNSVDVLNSVQQLGSARVELAQARAQFVVARLKLEAAVGALDETDIATANLWLSKP